eukprot:243166-Rhodomonas_salina.1
MWMRGIYGADGRASTSYTRVQVAKRREELKSVFEAIASTVDMVKSTPFSVHLYQAGGCLHLISRRRI